MCKRYETGGNKDIYNCMVQNGQCQVSTSPRQREYSKIKSKLDVEKYLESDDVNKNRRSFIAQLNLGILLLHIETGRSSEWSRLHEICSAHQVKNKHHFLFEC